MRHRILHEAGLLLATLALVGCPQNERGLELALRTLSLEGSGATSSDSLCNDAPLPNNYTLRITFLRRKVDESGAFSPLSSDGLRDYEQVCHRVVDPGTKSLELVVPDDRPQDNGRFTVRVEAFDGVGSTTPLLRYAGQVEELALDTDTSATIYLRPTANPTSSDFNLTAKAGLSCTRSALVARRAFHSATLLPNGHVLLIGGIAADTEDANSQLDLAKAEAYVTAQIEVYVVHDAGSLEESRSASFVGVDVATEEKPLVARAFHQAVLLPSLPQGPYRILLLGGVQPKALADPSFQLRIAKTSMPFLFTPHTTAVAAPAVLVTYYPETKTATARELQGLPRPMFPAIVQGETDLMLVGGAAAYKEEGGKSSFIDDEAGKAVYRIQLNNDGDPVPTRMTYALQDVRAGHALVELGSGQFVVLGGQMSGEQTAVDTGEHLATGGSAYTAFPYTPSGATSAISTAWHTLTPLGISDRARAQAGVSLAKTALWAGGYPLEYDSNTLRIAKAAPQAIMHLVTSTDSTAAPTIAPVPSADQSRYFQNVGYHAALELHDGSVLLSGGHTGNGTNAFSASQQLLVYKLTNDAGSPNLVLQLDRIPRLLNVPRFGHSMTRLLDNTVLIAGGITPQGDAAQVLNSAEVFSPRTGDASEDYPLLRGAPQPTSQAPEERLCQPRD